MQVEQLESTLLWGFQRPLDFFLIKDGCEPSRSLEIVIRTMEQPFTSEVVTYRFEIERVEHTRVFFYLPDIRIDTILAYLMRDERHRNVFGSGTVVTIKIGHMLIKHALSSHPSFVGPLCDEDVILWLLPDTVPFLKSESRREIEMPRIARLHVVSQLVEEVEIGLQFIAATDDAERGVVAVMTDDMVKLDVEESGGGSVFIDSQRPVGQFHLTIEAHLVGNTESGFGRAPRVETQVVEPILTGCRKHFHPSPFIHWRCACQWEDTALQGSSEESRVPVD